MFIFAGAAHEAMPILNHVILPNKGLCCDYVMPEHAGLDLRSIVQRAAFSFAGNQAWRVLFMLAFGLCWAPLYGTAARRLPH